MMFDMTLCCTMHWSLRPRFAPEIAALFNAPFSGFQQVVPYQAQAWQSNEAKSPYA
jgi:hypothetical protein